MWCIICVRAIIVYYNEIVTVRLPRNTWREKTLGEMWAAVIRTINNLLLTAWLWTRAPRNGDRAGVSRCSEGDHEGCIREVPQEERSPCIYIAQNVCIIVKRNFNLTASTAGKNQHPRFTLFTLLMCIRILFSCQQSLLFFPCTNVS
jgi:hypothetical protein